MKSTPSKTTHYLIKKKQKNTHTHHRQKHMLEHFVVHSSPISSPLLMDLAKEETSNLRKAFWLLRSTSENNNSSSLSLLFFFRQIMTLKNLWKILFISSKILFFVLKIFEFLYFHLPIFSSCQSLIEKVIEYLMLSSTA